jgi:DNA-binding NarL/FixJ family response regulator
VQELLRAGISAYVLKQTPSSELLQAIRAAAAGRQYLDSAITRGLTYSLVGRGQRRSASSISGREAEVLKLIAWGHSNKEIAAQLDLSVKTIEVHKANAMRKLDLHGRIDIVRYALLQGWLKEE